MNVVPTLLLSLMLAAGTAWVAHAQTQADVEQIEAQISRCTQALETNANYQDFFRHIPTSANPQPTLEQLADNSFVTPSEVKEILDWYKAVQNCRNQFLSGMGWALPDTVPIYKSAYSSTDLIYADLIQRRITWGDAIRRRMQVIEILNTRLEVANQRRQAAAEANDQATNNALMQMGQQLMRPTIPNSVIPTTTMCNRLGMWVTCNTR